MASGRSRRLRYRSQGTTRSRGLRGTLWVGTPARCFLLQFFQLPGLSIPGLHMPLPLPDTRLRQPGSPPQAFTWLYFVFLPLLATRRLSSLGRSSSLSSPASLCGFVPFTCSPWFLFDALFFFCSERP